MKILTKSVFLALIFFSKTAVAQYYTHIQCIDDLGYLRVQSVGFASNKGNNAKINNFYEEDITYSCSLGEKKYEIIISSQGRDRPNGWCGASPSRSIVMKQNGVVFINEAYEYDCTNNEPLVITSVIITDSEMVHACGTTINEDIYKYVLSHQYCSARTVKQFIAIPISDEYENSIERIKKQNEKNM